MKYRHADTEWMRSDFGISVHWTSHTVCLDGTKRPFAEAVERFDAERFADAVAETGAAHCIFTLTHAEQYLAMPNPVLERLLPGRTAGRDLIGEIIEALKKRNVRFIAYYNHSCNGNDDPRWKEACGYAAGVNGNLDRFAQNICGIVSCIGKRYGRGICGWWFDSGYSVDPRGPVNTISCELGEWRFPWEALAAAAKSGNPEAAAAVNAGIGSRFLYTDCQDYYAGETVEPDQVFEPEAVPEMRDHRWICADSPAWVFGRKSAENGFAEPRFTDGCLKRFIGEHLDAGRMVTLNLLVDQSGIVNPKAVRQIGRIRPRS